MDFIGNNEFEAWIRDLGITFDDRGGPNVHAAPLCSDWPWPEHQESWPHFVSSLLQGIDPWETIVVWPRAGHWLLPPNNIEAGVIRRGDAPKGWAGGVRFSREEVHAAIAVTFVHMSFGWCMPHDLFLIPNHGRQHIEVNHDELAYVNCQSESRVDAFVTHMTTMGFLTRFEALERDERDEPIAPSCGGVVENGLVHAIDPEVKLPEQSRVIIIGV